MDVFTGNPREADTDLIIVGAFEGQTAALQEWSGPTRGEVGRAIASGEFSGKPYELFVTPIVEDGYRPGRLAAIGLGPRADFTSDRARRAASAAALAARQRKIARVAFVADDPLDSPEMVQALAEGLTLAEFDAGQYKTVDYEPFRLRSLGIVIQEAARGPAGAAAKRGQVIGEYCNVARQLANEPGNALTPSVFAERLVAIAGGAGLTVEVLDEHDLAGLGMGMLLGVGRGSDEPPRVVVIRYEPEGAPASPVLGLVGKGITFDTGGISIKPATDMERMKDDMSGGAAVAAAMRAIAKLGAPIRVVGVVPTAENMPGGRAVKPGDILRSAEGKTVEVLNTDAEGRLVLGDGLWYARKLGATHLVDVATLTGAVVVALGKTTSGIFGTPESWVNQVRAVADRAGDRMWPLPIFEDYREQLKSEIADFTNTGGRAGGSITAALFLKEFSGGLPWAHIDIAGTAWVEDPKPYLPKGPSGVAVRTLAELAFTSDSWRTT